MTVHSAPDTLVSPSAAEREDGEGESVEYARVTDHGRRLANSPPDVVLSSVQWHDHVDHLRHDFWAGHR